MGHSTVEWVYIGVVIALLIYIGASAWDVQRFVDHAPKDSKVVKVIGQQWFWTFEHEDGKKELGELHLVEGTPYRFEITSKDVNHSFNIPDLAVLMDAVPGRINHFWVMPDASGEYLIQCREYCGFSHYQMRAKLFVEETIPVSGETEVSNVPVSVQEAKPVIANN